MYIAVRKKNRCQGVKISILSKNSILDPLRDAKYMPLQTERSHNSKYKTALLR